MRNRHEPRLKAIKDTTVDKDFGFRAYVSPCSDLAALTCAGLAFVSHRRRFVLVACHRISPAPGLLH